MSCPHRVRVGCSGWNYDSWRDTVYPHGLARAYWLEQYARRFDTVEVNATFYRLASATAVSRWAQQTPDGFVFAVKGSRYLTHVRRLADAAEGLRRFCDPLAPLARADRLGPVLWQLPESFRRDDERLAGFLALLPPGRHAFEFRHDSWFAPPVYELLREHDVALVVGDHPLRPFQTREPTAGWDYLRLHYGHRGRRGNYSRAELGEWAGWLRERARQRDAYVYFNNDWESFAPRNAELLRELLAGDRLAA